jgi:Zn-finger protein
MDSEEESNTGKQWECRKCKWVGSNVKEKELTEDEFMEYLDEKGEEVA